jgi:hypothetical protein
MSSNVGGVLLHDPVKDANPGWRAVHDPYRP